MWENATPKPPETAAEPHPRKRKREEPPGGQENYILWAQLLLAALLVGAAFAAKQLQSPLYSVLRTNFTTAMQAKGPDWLQEERGFVRFTQEMWREFGQAAQEVFADQTIEPGPTTERPAHKRPPPYGSSEESYQPDFAMVFPLQDTDCANNSTYGWRNDPLEGESAEFHTGTDLACAQGSAVYAAADGIVRVAGTHESYGNYLRLLHPNGDETLYAHLQYLFVRPGEQVAAGQQIGTAGQTGRVTGPHLHFELLHEGVRYDPTQALQQAVAP